MASVLSAVMKSRKENGLRIKVHAQLLHPASEHKAMPRSGIRVSERSERVPCGKVGVEVESEGTTENGEKGIYRSSNNKRCGAALHRVHLNPSHPSLAVLIPDRWSQVAPSQRSHS